MINKLLSLTHANPAKFVFAEFAIHMITSLILFNSCIAFGTFFGVSEDPICGFTFVHTLGGPFRQLGTARGIVSLFTTSETKRICTGTAYSGDTRSNSDLVTSSSWTISHGFTRFDEISSHKHGVPVPYFCIQKRPKEQPRHRLRTFMLWTVSTNACRSLSDLISEIFPITKLAKFMITSYRYQVVEKIKRI